MRQSDLNTMFADIRRLLITIHSKDDPRYIVSVSMWPDKGGVGYAEQSAALPTLADVILAALDNARPTTPRSP